MLFFVCRQLVQLPEVLLRRIEGGEVGGVRASELTTRHLHNLLSANQRQLGHACLRSFLALLLEDGGQRRRHTDSGVVFLHV